MGTGTTHRERCIEDFVREFRAAWERLDDAAADAMAESLARRPAADVIAVWRGLVEEGTPGVGEEGFYRRALFWDFVSALRAEAHIYTTHGDQT